MDDIVLVLVKWSTIRLGIGRIPEQQMTAQHKVFLSSSLS